MKTIFSLVVLCLPLIANAQIEKGNSFVSGFIGLYKDYSKNGSIESKESSFQIGGQYGYLFADR